MPLTTQGQLEHTWQSLDWEYSNVMVMLSNRSEHTVKVLHYIFLTLLAPQLQAQDQGPGTSSKGPVLLRPAGALGPMVPGLQMCTEISKRYEIDVEVVRLCTVMYIFAYAVSVISLMFPDVLSRQI